MYKKENLAKIKKMNSLAPEVMTAFWAFDRASVADGAIPVKYKELIAVAVALTTQCPYCIDYFWWSLAASTTRISIGRFAGVSSRPSCSRTAAAIRPGCAASAPVSSHKS